MSGDIGNGNGRGAGRGADGPPFPARRLNTQERARALELGHVFPGTMPVVVIARADLGVAERLEALVAHLQGDQAYAIATRASAGGKYASYRVDMHVEDAMQALARRDAIAAMDDVLLIL